MRLVLGMLKMPRPMLGKKMYTCVLKVLIFQDAADVLEFVETCCSTFLADVSLVSALNRRFFPDQVGFYWQN